MSSSSSLSKTEPVLVTSYVTAVVTWVLGLLVTHGVLTHTQASAVTQQVAPMIAAAVVALAGHVARRYVTPVERAIESKLGPTELAAIQSAVLQVVAPDPASDTARAAPPADVPVVDDSALPAA